MDICDLTSCCCPPFLHFLSSDNQNSIRLKEGFEDKGALAVSLNGYNMKNSSSFYKELSEAFNFPDYFGENFNALSECITDLSWLPINHSIILMIENSEYLLSEEPNDFMLGFVDIINDAGEEWGQSVNDGEEWDRAAIAFHVIFQVAPESSSLFIEKVSNLNVQIDELKFD